MNHPHTQRLIPAGVRAGIFSALLCGPLHAQQWTVPTAEELKMTSIPEVPDAPAVELYREEITDDDNHMRSRYLRIKVLNEAGKHYGDVEIQFDKRGDGAGYTATEIAGRTIQPDGTIIPFTGKPYEKLLEADKENQYRAKVFSLPAVQVGSILEYRYKLRWEDNLFRSPDWIVQTEVFLRNGHFVWKPTDHELLSHTRGNRESTTSALAWASALPKGTQVVSSTIMSNRRQYTLDVKNILPFQTDEFMPPLLSGRYHVYFYYTPYHDAKEYWATEGKYWSADTNRFIGKSDAVRDAANQAVAGETTDEGKLKKLYALTGTLENTDYTRRRTAAENKSAGLKDTKSAEDVLKRRRGSGDEITLLFVALCRAVGLDANAAAAANRMLLLPDLNWLYFDQFSDDIATVRYGGNVHFYDPGTPMTAFGHLDWRHTSTGAVMQQTGTNTTAILTTPIDPYTYSHSTRIAEIHLEEDGAMQGDVYLTYEGNPAAELRQSALRTDEAELHEDVKQRLLRMLPGGTEVTIKSIDGLKDPSAKLKVTGHVTGRIGNAVGSRVVLPADIFTANDSPAFPHAHRDSAVYLNYTYFDQDATRYHLPAGYSVESTPTEEKMPYRKAAYYHQRSTSTNDSVSTWRDLMIADFLFPVDEFPALRGFFVGFEKKDRNSILLKRGGSEKATLEKPAAQQ